MPRRDQITSSPLSPTTVPINRHLQNRGPSETHPDGPAATVTRGALSPPPGLPGPDSCQLHQSRRVANNNRQGVSPTLSHDSLTHREIPLPAQVPGKIETLRDVQKPTRRSSGSPLPLCSQPSCPSASPRATFKYRCQAPARHHQC